MQPEECRKLKLVIIKIFLREIFWLKIKMVRPCRCLDILAFQDEQVFFLTHLCTLWRRNKPLIRPLQEFASYTGLPATFRALSHADELNQAFFSRRFFL